MDFLSMELVPCELSGMNSMTQFWRPGRDKDFGTRSEAGTYDLYQRSFFRAIIMCISFRKISVQ